MKNIRNMNRNLTLRTFASLAFMSLIAACNPESPGLEYMPDMYRSPAVESYVDNSEYGDTEMPSARMPVSGTIPRGYQPFTFVNSLEGYEAAGEGMVNPLEKNTKNLEGGKLLYSYMCQHCHGKKGDGKGTITHPVYGAVPSYADSQPNRRGNRAMKDLKEGHIYHAIIYGLNAMGPHASQISENERWKIIMYVQTLQGTKAEVANTELADTSIAESTN